MSDGPHRSLAMPRSWRKAAECAASQSYELAEVIALIRAAREQDWKRHVPPALLAGVRKIFGDGRQGSLLTDSRSVGFDRLNPSATGHPLACSFLAAAVRAYAEGWRGRAGVNEAGRRTDSDWAQRRGRQIEEQYARKGGNVAFIRGRIRAANQACDNDDFAARLGYADRTPIPRKPDRQVGLDDGPRL